MSNENFLRFTVPYHYVLQLKQFKPYRHLLREKDNVYYKTGSLKGIRTRVGYINDGLGEFYYFVIFFNQPHYKMNATLDCVKKAVARQR